MNKYPKYFPVTISGGGGGDVTKEWVESYVANSILPISQTAQQAKQTAEQANETADTAEEEASDAKNVANEASSKADTADTKAENATNAANNAQLTANAAKETANEALSKAENNKVFATVAGVKQPINNLIAGGNTSFALDGTDLTISSQGGSGGITRDEAIQIADEEFDKKIVPTAESITEVEHEVAVAQLAAETAQSDADEAKTEANQASLAASAAQNKANQAENDAQSGITKANAAQHTADGAATAAGLALAGLDSVNSKINTTNANMAKIASVVTVDGEQQLTTPIDSTTWKLPIPITTKPAPAVISSGIPVYGFDGNYIKEFDTSVIPSVTVTNIKKPLPTKELYVSIQKIMPSYYPATFYYLAVTLNNGSVLTTNPRTALYGGYNLNYNDIIKSFGNFNTLPLTIRFTDLTNGNNFDITMTCDKTSTDMSSMDNFAYFIRSKVNSDPTYGTKAQAVSFMCKWNSDTNRIELSAQYNINFTLTLSPKTNALAATLKIIDPCIATWTVGTAGINSLQSGTPVLADVQRYLAGSSSKNISFTFSQTGTTSGLGVTESDCPDFYTLAKNLQDYLTTYHSDFPDVYFPDFRMSYDGTKFTISNGAVNQIKISESGALNDLLKISPLTGANIVNVSNLNIATSPFNSTRVSYQLSTINDYEEAVDTITRFKELKVSHNPIIVSSKVRSKINTVITQIRQLQASEELTNIDKKIYESFKSLINNNKISIDDFTTDGLYLKDVNAAINLTVDNEWITFRFDFSVIAQKYYLCTSNQALIKITSSKYSDQGTITNYPTRRVATWDVNSGSLTHWCLTNVLMDFGLLLINQLQIDYYDGTDINQGGANGNILYIPINLPLNRILSDSWQIQIPIVGDGVAIAKITTVRLVVLAQDDNLPSVPYFVQGKYKKNNGRIQYKEDIIIPATGAYPEIPASQNNPVVTLTCINNDITVNTSWTNANNAAVTSQQTQEISYLGGQSDLSLSLADSRIIGALKSNVSGDTLVTIVQTTDSPNEMALIIVPSGNVYTVSVKSSISLTDALQNNDSLNIGVYNVNNPSDCQYASVNPHDDFNMPVEFGYNHDQTFTLDTTSYTEDQQYRFVIFTTIPEVRRVLKKTKKASMSGSSAKVNGMLNFVINRN